ncbi:hypothetical protein ACLBXM_19605 [Xanthobacteraceae bacterium A53D]
MTKHTQSLGRPDPNEDKDQNVEQLKSKGGRKGQAGQPPQPAHPQEAERMDPTERTRAGDRK